MSSTLGDTTAPDSVSDSDDETGRITPPPAAVSDVDDTPVKYKLSGNYYSSTMLKCSERRAELAKEIENHIVGPMPAKEFLDLYVPGPTDEKFKFDNVWAKKLKSEMHKLIGRELQMYTPWVHRMNQKSEYLGELKLKDVSDKDLLQFCGEGIKPDIAVYEGHCDENGLIPLQNIELIGEFKGDSSHDPFVDDDPNCAHSRAAGRFTHLLQITSYATAHMGIQIRTHVFQFMVIGDYARLLRWDRSGVVVTEKISLDEEAFGEFFWRFAHMTPAQRGWDTFFVLPSDKEKEEAKVKLDEAEAKLGMKPERLPSFYEKVNITDEKESHGPYITHRLFYAATQSPFGRATRGYAAYCMKRREVVFLKATWRVVGDTRKPEHETYELLRAARVRNIPTVLFHLDDPARATRTQDVSKAYKKGDAKLRRLQPYFLVLKELGRDLTKFKSTKELLKALGDAAEAHEDAFQNAHILHRDISVGNIIILENGNGLLIDWDLAKHCGGSEGERQPERTGTFQFAAARLVNDVPHLNGAIHSREDDIESIFHVLGYNILRFFAHGIPPETLGILLSKTFDFVQKGVGGTLVCSGRLEAIKEGVVWQYCTLLDPMLMGLIEEIRRVITTRYLSPQEMEKARYYEEILKNHDILYPASQLNQTSLTVHQAQNPFEGIARESYREHAKPALLNNKLKEAFWLTTLLRDAADNCPDHGPSTPQPFEGIPKEPTQSTYAKGTTQAPSCRRSERKPPQKRGKYATAAQQVEDNEMSGSEGVAIDDKTDLDPEYKPGNNKRKKRT